MQIQLSQYMCGCTTERNLCIETCCIQSFCSFSLNIYGLEFSFIPVSLATLSKIRLILLFTYHLQMSHVPFTVKWLWINIFYKLSIAFEQYKLKINKLQIIQWDQHCRIKSRPNFSYLRGCTNSDSYLLNFHHFIVFENAIWFALEIGKTKLKCLLI